MELGDGGRAREKKREGQERVYGNGKGKEGEKEGEVKWTKRTKRTKGERQPRENMFEMSGLYRKERLGEGKGSPLTGKFSGVGKVRRAERSLASLCFGILIGITVSHLT